MAILIDYSQMIIAGALAFSSDFEKGKDTKKMVDIMRHTILTTILSDKKKFGKTYGQIVIAVDGRNYWRRNYFPPYKGSRKKNREESKTDWNSIFNIGTQLREEFNGLFPYKFVSVPDAEADDVIAVLTKYWQTNELTEGGVFLDGEPQPILIKSNDGDFKQLHKFKNVKQWNPILQKLVKPPEPFFLLEKLLTGDAGDGVPNIRSSDMQLMDGIRQPPITAKIKEKAIEQAKANVPITFGDVEMDRNYARNKTLIDFDSIPELITENVISTYKDAKCISDKGKIFNYFVQHRCKQLMTNIQEF